MDICSVFWLVEFSCHTVGMAHAHDHQFVSVVNMLVQSQLNTVYTLRN